MKNKHLTLSVLLSFSITTSANEENTVENSESTFIKPPIFTTCIPLPECDGDTSSQSFLQWSIDLITKEKEVSTESMKLDQKPDQ